MPLSAYERVKRWREKNRAIYNLRRRQARSERREGEEAEVKPIATVEELRELVREESEKVVGRVVKKPLIFRDSYGRVISEAQWELLQDRKARAKDGGYVLDEYSQ